MSSQDSSESWHCTVVPNCPFEQFSRCLKAHKRDYHSKFNSFPYKGHSETMHRRSDGKFDCPCGHPMHRRFSYEKLRALCRAGIHPPPETTKYNDFPIDNALSLTKHVSVTPWSISCHSRSSPSPKAIRASRIIRTKKKVLDDDILSVPESDEPETDDTPISTGSSSQSPTSHVPTDAQGYSGLSMLVPSKKSFFWPNLKYIPQHQPRDPQPPSPPSPTRSGSITTYTRGPRPYLPHPLISNQPKNRAKELERKGVIVDSKGIKHKLKNDTSRPLVQTGLNTTLASTSLREGRSIRGSSHDQAPASGSSPAGNPQGDQNCNTQFSGLPSRSNNPSSLPETDALVQKAATLKRERAVLEEELVNKRMEIIDYIATLEVENLARRRKLSIMDKVMRV